MNSQNEAKIRVFIADDQDMIVQGLRYIIDAQTDMMVAATTNTGQAALNALQTSEIDVALLDIRMPERTGIEVSAALKAAGSLCRVVLLTTFDHADYVAEGIRAGAVGFLLKDAPTEQLLEGIRRAAKGEVFFWTANAQDALANLHTAGNVNESPGLTLTEQLTEREQDVLQCMAYGWRNQEIAEHMHVSIGTIKTHVHRIIQKMDVEDRTQAVIRAIRGGLVD